MADSLNPPGPWSREGCRPCDHPRKLTDTVIWSRAYAQSLRLSWMTLSMMTLVTGSASPRRPLVVPTDAGNSTLRNCSIWSTLAMYGVVTPAPLLLPRETPSRRSWSRPARRTPPAHRGASPAGAAHCRRRVRASPTIRMGSPLSSVHTPLLDSSSTEPLRTTCTAPASLLVETPGLTETSSGRKAGRCVRARSRSTRFSTRDRGRLAYDRVWKGLK